MKMVLNELSYKIPFATIFEARLIMHNLMKVYKAGVKLKLDKALIIEDSFNGIYLAPNYPIEHWRNDKEVDTELRRIYKRLNDFVEFYSDYSKDILDTKEFITACGSGTGLIIANELQYISISFCSDALWDTNIVVGEVHVLDEDTGELLISPGEALHASEDKHLLSNYERIQCRLLEEQPILNDGKELWYRKEELFPNLVFCEHIRKELYQIRKGDKELKQITSKLRVLDEYFSKWNGIFDKNAIANIDPESETTLNQYRKEHTFQTPDGNNILFSWHMRFTGGNYEGRIFFEPDSKSGDGIIGNIGKKLPTASWPNP